MHLRAISTVVAMTMGVACGLDVVGSALPVDASVTAAPGDAGADSVVEAGDAAIDVPTCVTASTTCITALAAGWSPVAFAPDRGMACPAGYITLDLVTSPSVSEDACTCACQIDAADPPTCAKGSFAGSTGSSSCTNTGATLIVDGGGCTPIGFAAGVPAYGKYTPLPLTPGKCISSVNTDVTKLASPPVRGCVPPAACMEDVCLGAAAAPFRSCIAHDGDVACPPGPFANKIVAGARATLKCGGCATCANSATCSVASLRFYNNSSCTGELATRLADGNCNALASGNSGVTVSHFKYDVATNSPTCTPTSDPITSVGLDQPRTICCR